MRIVEGLGFSVRFAAFALLFQLLGKFFALLRTGFRAFLSLLVELVLGAEEFDVGHLGSITLAGSEARDAEIAAVACTVARCNRGEETIDRLRRHEVGRSLTACVNSALLAEGDHLLNERTSGLALGDGGLDPVVEDDRGDEVAQNGAAMAVVA